MNRTYGVVWSQVRRVFVAASELAKIFAKPSKSVADCLIEGAVVKSLGALLPERYSDRIIKKQVI